ncbi:sulfatase maturation enzyme AslB (radical SAM superfamily) [Bradyrhizobium sp. AZCC 2262]|uniref:radical SAM protein n=1 Tax=Bradyrhizobium sp. AZCC 2262 TaxID=3117022 RepID=UPI002FF3DB68
MPGKQAIRRRMHSGQTGKGKNCAVRDLQEPSPARKPLWLGPKWVGYAANVLSILWHAGEPLVVPPTFYRKAFDILEEFRPPQVGLKHCIQSNGTLISDEWCALFRDHQVEIGISIDGPQELHDRYRVSRNGRGTFHRTVAGIKRLRSFGIPFHVIAVLTRESLRDPEVIFSFFEELQPNRVHFNIEEIEGINRESSLNFIEVREELARFRQARDSGHRSSRVHESGLMTTEPNPRSP